jgi:NAD(P)-dependent dehydrogenase (short-subunit alcohol dehydrogenase family)
LQITANLGGLDVLINNASALGPTPLALLADTECEELEQALMVNLLGPFRLTKALFGALATSARNGRGAAVINISSDAAVTPYVVGRLRRQQGGSPPSHSNLGRRG